MIDPDRIKKGDWLWLAGKGDQLWLEGDAQRWVEVERLPWAVPAEDTPERLCWWVGVWELSDDGTRELYYPAALELAQAQARNGVELWNAEDDPAQLALFEDGDEG